MTAKPERCKQVGPDDLPRQTVQQTASNVHAVIRLLREHWPSARLIAIDGVGGAGKSALGAQLTAAFDGAPVVWISIPS